MMGLEDALRTARKFFQVAPTNAANTPSLSRVHPAYAGASYAAPLSARNRGEPSAVGRCMLRWRDCSTRKVNRKRKRTDSDSVSHHLTSFPSLARSSKLDLVFHAHSTSLCDELPREVSLQPVPVTCPHKLNILVKTSWIQRLTIGLDVTRVVLRTISDRMRRCMYVDLSFVVILNQKNFIAICTVVD